MKAIFIIFLSLFISNIQAGEFSEIDQEVRETIIETFDVDFEGNDLGQIDYNDDIWNLEVKEFDTESCLLEVSAYFNKPVTGGSQLSIAWVCINKAQNGGYEGEVLDHDVLAD